MTTILTQWASALLVPLAMPLVVPTTMARAQEMIHIEESDLPAQPDTMTSRDVGGQSEDE